MADYNKLYQSRVISAEDAVKQIKSGDRVFLTGNCSVPQKVLGALVDYAPNLQDVEICHALSIGAADYVKPEMKGHLQVNTMFASASIRQAVNDGRADFTPVLLSEFTLLFKNKLPAGRRGADPCFPTRRAWLLQPGGRSWPDQIPGRISQDHHRRSQPEDAAYSGRLVHPSQPLELPGAGGLRAARAADVRRRADETVDRIAQHIAELIPDGATMQMGIGAIPDAVLNYLKDKKDLGIHSELFSDGVIELVELGVLTGARKSIHPGKMIAGFILGSRRLYEWVDDNPLIELHPTEYVNDPFVIAQNEKQVAINSAIEIDLTGQVCADSIGPKIYSGVGGQLDFVYGASRSKGGVPIIALPSTTTLRDGRVISRIVNMLNRGAGVVTSRNHVHYVVTEYGVADLYGKSIRRRAEQLINIAHPDFRDELTRQAQELHYI